MYSEKPKEKKNSTKGNYTAVRNNARRQKHRKELGDSISNETERSTEKFEDTK